MERTERYFCVDANGRDLFYIDLQFEDFKFIHFYTSLKYNLFDFPQVNFIVNKITDCDTLPIDRISFIDQLCVYVKELPGISSYYFRDYVLDKNGRYMEFYDSVLNKLLFDKEFENYTVFSIRIHSFYFEFLAPYLKGEIISNKAIPVERQLIEGMLQNNIELSNEYVNTYSPHTHFFLYFFTDKYLYKCYIQMEANDINLFFILKY
jgi:hypothetical protein